MCLPTATALRGAGCGASILAGAALEMRWMRSGGRRASLVPSLSEFSLKKIQSPALGILCPVVATPRYFLKMGARARTWSVASKAAVSIRRVPQPVTTPAAASAVLSPAARFRRERIEVLGLHPCNTFVLASSTMRTLPTGRRPRQSPGRPARGSGYRFREDRGVRRARGPLLHFFLGSWARKLKKWRGRHFT